MRRQLQRVAVPAIATRGELDYLSEQERQKLRTGGCRCYLSRDSHGAVTLFLVLTFSATAERTSAVRAEYSCSLGDLNENILA
jgi:hypothetical protein